MKEKFSDFESVQFLAEAGEFVFTVTDYELKDSVSGEFPVATFNVKCDKGVSTIRHSLNPKARWSYNGLIKACLKLDTTEKINSFECDYQIIGQDLVGKQFIGVVECETYEKSVKKPNDDGTFSDAVEVREGYKIKSYKLC